MTAEDVITEVLRREGGYVNHASDRGGPTNYGITLKTLAAWRGQPVTAEDVLALTEAEARDIYRREYIERPGLDQIADPLLRGLLVDYAVHSGPRRAIEELQRVAGVTVDGKIGPQTLSAVAVKGAESLRRGVLRARGRYLARLLSDPSQRVFAGGWLNRLMEFV
jgi:lysozyme family protein